MTRAVLVATLAFVALLAAAPAALAQSAVDDEIGYSVPTDGLFSIPGDPGWTSDVIAFWWLVPLVVVSLTLLWVIQWVDADARRVGLDPKTWNCGGLALALVSLVAFFALPPWVALPAALAGVLAVLWNYIPARNAKVLPTRRLFTVDHRKALKLRTLAKFGIRPASMEKRLAKIAKEHVPVTVFDARGRTASPADAPFDEADPMTEVKEILGHAGARHAREVEIVPKPGGVLVSCLIDGLVHGGPTFDRLRGNAAMLLIKKTLIESASPQFRVQFPTLGNRAFTVRTCVYGEGDTEWMRLRLTADDEGMRKFDELGLPAVQAAAVRAALDAGRGLMVVASPAAMGARTTTYALLDALDPFSRNILTFERPVAGKLASIEQRDFADGPTLAAMLQEALRKDPDLVMLSDLPDAAAAETALTAARRDQLFLVRLELPDAASVPPWLVRLGATPEAVAAGVHTIVAQRLVRTLCPSCRRKVDPPVGLLQKIGVDPAHVEHVWEESSGCDACGQTGFLGRTGIFEIWQPSAESRRRIGQNAPVETLHSAALHDGMRSLQQSGLALVLEGVTSLRELARALKVV